MSHHHTKTQLSKPPECTRGMLFITSQQALARLWLRQNGSIVLLSSQASSSFKACELLPPSLPWKLSVSPSPLFLALCFLEDVPLALRIPPPSPFPCDPNTTTMHLRNSLLLLGATWSELVSAVPVQDSPPPRQRLLDGKPLPSRYRKAKNPYTPDYRDPLDKAVDSVGDELDPLPYRNGLGASVLGPWNWERSRQSPDLVRPPSTDHGNIANMRWSFVDSHVRIEVRSPEHHGIARSRLSPALPC